VVTIDGNWLFASSAGWLDDELIVAPVHRP
jgi:hypothetical protein